MMFTKIEGYRRCIKGENVSIHYILSMTTFLLLGVAVAAGQERMRVVEGRVVISPEAMELERQKYEKLKNPTFLTLGINEIPDRAKNNSTTVANVYKAGRPIRFHLLITNSSAEPIELRFSDTYSQNRPQLFKEGQLVPYRDKVSRLVQAKDKELLMISDYPVLLDINKTASRIIDLGDWYKTLDAGRYELNVRHRFVWDGAWLETPSISFEIQHQ